MNNSTQKNLVKGFGYLLSSDIDKALGEFKQLVLDNNDTIEVYIALGSLFRKKGELSKAIHIHEGVLNRKDISSDVVKYVMHELAQDYRLAGQYDKALHYLNQLIAKDKSPVLMKMLADIQFEMKKLDDAIKSYVKYQKFSGKSMTKQISNCYVEKANDFENKSSTEYHKLLKKALKTDPNHRKLNLLHAEFLMNAPKKAKGVEAVRAFMENGYVKSAADLNFVKSVYFEHLNIETFVKSVLRKVAAEDKNPIYVVTAADHFSKIDEVDKAVGMLKKFIDEIQPSVAVVRKYAELKGEEVLFSLYKDKDNYKCSGCGETFQEYYETCGKCKQLETLEPM